MKDDKTHKCIANMQEHKKIDCPLLKGMREIV